MEYTEQFTDLKIFYTLVKTLNIDKSSLQNSLGIILFIYFFFLRTQDTPN